MLERSRSLMNQSVRDALVTGFELLIPTITLPDPDDRHVVAAAIHSGASLIVTFNLKDFPAEALRPYNLTVQLMTLSLICWIYSPPWFAKRWRTSDAP